MILKLHVYTLFLAVFFGGSNNHPAINQAITAPSDAIESEVILWITDATSKCGETFCAHIRARDFNAIDSLEFSLNWDPSLIRYVSSAVVADTLNNSVTFDETETTFGRFGFSWHAEMNEPNGVSLPRDQILFEICMEDQLNASATVPIDFADAPVAQKVSSVIDPMVNLVTEDIRAIFECNESCKAAFAFSVLDSCGSVQFYNESIGDNLNYSWNFGDGNTSQDESPEHTFLMPDMNGYDVFLEVTDNNGCRDEISQNIVVSGQDQTIPVIICPRDTAVDCNLELIPENTGELMVMDNCGTNGIQITYSDEITTQATCSRVIKRTWAVVDKANNIETCIQIISAIDMTGPEITECPAGISVSTNPGECGADVMIIPPIPVDACNEVLTLTNDFNNTNLASGFYPIGTTIVTWSARDICGNVTADCSHSVTVIDEERPTIVCNAMDTTLQASRGALGATLNFPLPVGMDNCSAELVGSHQSGDFFPCGETIVTFNAVDPEGNLSETCQFTVTVVCDLAIDFDPLACGMAAVTKYSGNRQENNPQNNVFEVIDIREQNASTQNQNIADQFNFIQDPRWTAFNMGEVFGTAIDDQQFIYLTSTTIYPENYFGANHENTGGEIYRINPNTGMVELFQRLPNTGQGLGNICFANHQSNRFLYVTNWEDGFVYQIDLTSWNGNPDSDANYVAFDLFLMDDDAPGYAPIGQLTWGIGYNSVDERLYVSRWTQNGGELAAPNQCTTCTGPDASTGIGPNTVYSIPLDQDGELVLEELKPEIRLARVYQIAGLDTLISNPVSDIAFNTQGNLLLTEKSMCCPDEAGAGRARVLEYQFTNNTWTPIQDKTIYVGAAGSNNATNSAGGIDYGYDRFDPNNLNLVPDCDSIIWTSADISPYNTFGVMGIPASGNSSSAPDAFYIDFGMANDETEYRTAGDIEIFKCGCPLPSVSDFCDSLVINTTLIGQPDSCCWTIDLGNHWDLPHITRLEAELLTPNLIFSDVTSDPNFAVGFSNPNPHRLISLRSRTNTIPNGDFSNVLTFCLEGDGAGATQEIEFRWFEQIPDRPEELVCAQTLSSDCVPSDVIIPCITLLRDSVYCDGMDFHTYEFEIRNDLDRPVTKIFLFPDSMNSNITIEPNVINLPNPLFGGNTITLSTNLFSDTVIFDTTRFALSYVAGISDSEFYCSFLENNEIELTRCCQSCETVDLVINTTASDDSSCCYSLDLINECPENELATVELEILTTGATFGSFYTDGVDSIAAQWSNPIQTKSRLQWTHQSGVIPAGEFDNLINFCLDSTTIASPDTVNIAVRWLESNGRVNCQDTLVIDCTPPDNLCATVEVDTISYFRDTFLVHLGISNPEKVSFSFTFLDIEPGSVCITPILASTPICIPENEVCADFDNGCEKRFYLTNAEPGDTIKYQLTLTDPDNLDGFGWQCFESDTFEIILPIIPRLVCPDDIISQCCGMVQLPDPVILDTAGNAQVVCTRSDGEELDDPFTKGATQITCIATNDFGRMDTCTYEVIVVDTLGPVVQCPIVRDTLIADLQCNGAITPDYTQDRTIIDSCLMGITLLQTPRPGTLLPPGKYEVQISAIDACRNVGSCSFELAVLCNQDMICNNLNLDYERDQSSPDSCCYDFRLTNIDNGYYPYLQVFLMDQGSYSQIMPMNGWTINQTVNTDTLTLFPPGDSITPMDIGAIARICTDNFEVQPHQLQLDWYTEGIDDELFAICSDTLAFDCPAFNCCQDENVFQNRISNLDITYSIQDCYVEISWTGLAECDGIQWDWGDGSQTAIIRGDSMLRHTFNTNGPHNVCYVAEETLRSGSSCWVSDTLCLPEMVPCASSIRTCEPCDDRSVVGPNLISNGDFESGNNGSFESDLIFAPMSEMLIGQYGVRNRNNLDTPNWDGIDHTSGQDNGQYLAATNTSSSVIWRDSIPVDPNQRYTFCAYVNNLLLPELDEIDPDVEVRINGRRVVAPVTIPENPDLWLLISGDWTSGTEEAAIIEVSTRINQIGTYAIGLDDITFQSCTLDTCQADFDFVLAFDNGNNNCGTVNFTDLSSGVTALSHFWDFGDDSTSTAANPSHQYMRSGTYTACLTITTELNCQDSICKEVVIAFNEAPPVITCPENIVIPATTADCEALFTPGDPLLTVSICSAGASVACTRDDGLMLTDPYPVGNTVITCVATDNLGSSTCSYLITVTDENCPATCCLNQSNFENRVNDGFTYSIDNCDLVVTPNNLNDCHQVVWTWGDENTARSDGSMPVVHSYATNNSFEVCMQVIELDENGMSCFPAVQSCMLIDVACDTTCTCGIFEGFAFGQDLENLIELDCGGDPIELSCPVLGQSYNLVGNFACNGNCEANGVHIQIAKGDSIVDLGVVELSEGILDASIASQFFHLPGQYSMLLSSDCGENTCTCSFDFIVPEACDCRCDDFKGLTLMQGDNSYRTMCQGDTVLLDCPVDDLALTGLFECQGMACDNLEGQIDWTLELPNGTQLTNAVSTGEFEISFLPAFVEEPGLYKLELASQCGVNGCTCTLFWEQPDCDPCACPIRTFNYNYTQVCNQVTFDFTAVETCDSIKLDFGDGTSDFFIGGQTINHWYPQTGDYDACYYILRAGINTEESCTETDCIALSVGCVQELTSNNELLRNSGFVQARGRIVEEWELPNSNNPTFIRNEGCEDTGYFNFTNDVSPDSLYQIYQDSIGLLANENYEVTLCIRSNRAYPLDQLVNLPRFYLVASNQALTDPDLTNCTDCAIIGVTPNVVVADNWITIRLDDWVPTQDYSIFSLVLGGLKDSFIPPNLRLQVDNIYLGNIVTGTTAVRLLDNVRVYPNPTDDQLNILFDKALDQDYQITLQNTLGAKVIQGLLPNQTVRESYDLSNLPRGIYVLEILSKDQKKYYREKIVVQ